MTLERCPTCQKWFCDNRAEERFEDTIDNDICMLVRCSSCDVVLGCVECNKAHKCDQKSNTCEMVMPHCSNEKCGAHVHEVALRTKRVFQQLAKSETTKEKAGATNDNAKQESKIVTCTHCKSYPQKPNESLVQCHTCKKLFCNGEYAEGQPKENASEAQCYLTYCKACNKQLGCYTCCREKPYDACKTHCTQEACIAQLCRFSPVATAAQKATGSAAHLKSNNLTTRFVFEKGQ